MSFGVAEILELREHARGSKSEQSTETTGKGCGEISPAANRRAIQVAVRCDHQRSDRMDTFSARRAGIGKRVQSHHGWSCDASFRWCPVCANRVGCEDKREGQGESKVRVHNDLVNCSGPRMT